MGLPSLIVNFDELADLIKDYLQNGINVDVQGMTFNTTEMENLLREISGKIQGVNYSDLITALNDLGAKFDSVNGSLGLSGTQKIYGKMLEVYYYDETNQKNIIEFTAPSNGRITGITYSLSAWNYEDSWDLVVGGTTLFTGVRTKEYGEHKFFNVFYPVTGGQVINFTYNNVSQSSRVLWVDFNILED